MMQISCAGCGKKYRIDEDKIKGSTARFRCKACDHVIVVSKPQRQGPVTPPVGKGADRAGASKARTGISAEIVEERAPGPAGGEERVKVSEDISSPGASKIRFGLVGKVITVMLVVSLVPLGLFWGITFKQSTDRVQENAKLQMAQIAEGLGNQVDEWIDKNVRVLKTSANLSDIVSMERAKQEPILRAVAAEYPWMYLVFTVGPEGMNVARNDGKPLRDYSDRQYYKDVMNGKDLTWQTLIGKTSKKPALVMAVPIKSGETLVGVMAAAMTIDDISKSVARWRKGRTGFAFLVDENGKVVSHQVDQYVLTQKNLGNHPLIAEYWKKKTPTTLQFQDENGESSLGHVRGNKYGWALAVQQQYDEVFEMLKGVQYFAVILLVVTVVLVSLVAWFSAKRITTPIMKLVKAAEQMSLGQLNVEIDVKSKDEIGLLAQAIGRMQTSLRLAIERLRRRG